MKSPQFPIFKPMLSLISRNLSFQQKNWRFTVPTLLTFGQSLENILEHLPPRNSENILKMVAVLSGGSATPKFSGTGKVASWLWGECNSKLFRCRGLTFCSANVRLMYRQFFTYHCNLLSIWLLNTGACTINGEERPCGQLESKTLCYHKAKVALASRFLFYSPPPLLMKSCTGNVL